MNEIPPGAADAARPTLSVVVPVKDEQESIPPLLKGIRDSAAGAGLSLAEIVVIDDGSTDGTWRVLERLVADDVPGLLALRLRRNFGKATALMVGAEAATGDIIVTMDGDLQDDPAELPRFVAAIEAGADLVSGWKKDRNDPLSKTLPSRLFNWVTARASGIALHDFNCGFKAYRREIFGGVQLYGELHRYTPVLADAHGYRVMEIEVRHHARKFGRTKYGFARFLRGFLDLLTVLTITRYAYRPSHLFGGIGVLLLIIGGAAETYLVLLKLFTGAQIGDRPLMILGALAAIIGVQLLLFGVLAELIVSRTQGPTDYQDLVASRIGRDKRQE